MNGCGVVSKTIVVCCTLVFACLIAAFVLLSFRGIDTTPLLAFVVAITVNTIPAILAMVKSYQTDKKVDSVALDVAQVVEHTNGPIAETVQSVKDMREDLNAVLKQGDTL